MFDVFALNWFRVDNKIPSFIIPKNIKNWLIDKNSITQKLKNIYPDFRVKLLQENTINIAKNILDIEEAIKREVLLCAGDIELIYAVSFIPKNCNDLRNLNNKPLGEILFKNAKRESIEITKTNNNIWGRRSIFRYKNHKIMVCEFFTKFSKNNAR